MNLEWSTPLVCCEIAVGQFVSENRQLYVTIALQLARNVKRILVQLTPAGGKVATRQILIVLWPLQNMVMPTYGRSC